MRCTFVKRERPGYAARVILFLGAAVVLLVGWGVVASGRPGQKDGENPPRRIEDIGSKVVLADWAWQKHGTMRIGLRLVVIKRQLFCEVCRINIGQMIFSRRRFPQSVIWWKLDFGSASSPEMYATGELAHDPERFLLHPGDVFINRARINYGEGPLESGRYKVKVGYGEEEPPELSLEVRLPKDHGIAPYRAPRNPR